MPSSGSERVETGSFLGRHLQSGDARFRFAVTLGFLVVAVGSLAGAPGARVLFADDLWPFAALFGHAAQPAERSYDPAPAPRVRLHHTVLRRSDGTASAAPHAPMAIARQSICVRTCDGFAFPVGTYHGESDRVTQQSVCQAACPDAKTALYVLPTGSDRMSEAVNAASGRPYSALPDAFHYTSVLDDACTCHRPGGKSRTLSLLRDITLRRGDAVMTAHGFRVFHGAARYPYRRSDFFALSRSRDVRQSDRPTFSALERESLKAQHTAPVPVARRATPVREAAVDRHGA